jgi:hypothetical protein
LSQRHDEAGVHRQQEHEIELAGADVFGDLHAVGQEQRAEQLLDEMTRADEQYHLPFRPIPDVIGVAVDDNDEGELQGKPQEFDDNP